jgi:hypothetical protein
VKEEAKGQVRSCMYSFQEKIIIGGDSYSGTESIQIGFFQLSCVQVQYVRVSSYMELSTSGVKVAYYLSKMLDV